MKVELKMIKVKDVMNGFEDNGDNGVVGYGGKLDIRPAFQREFIYDSDEQQAVIHSVINGFPLNSIYWSVSGKDTYELLDGQQRIMSICNFCDGQFSIKVADGTPRAYHNLSNEDKNKIMDYELTVYFCEGTDNEKLEWFKIINVQGERLNDQELRNAIYCGSWLTDAKLHFSRIGSSAHGLSSKYVKAVANRQEYLETALKWISSSQSMTIEEYMSQHQHDSDASDLWIYYNAVIEWVKAKFPHYRNEMKGIDWGTLYNEYKNTKLDVAKLEKRIGELMLDDEVSNKKGIYYYVLDGKEKHLNLRTFTVNQKNKAYAKCKGICRMCKEEGRPKTHYEMEEMEADHIIPWIKGGKTEDKNCEMLCIEHNRHKSGN